MGNDIDSLQNAKESQRQSEIERQQKNELEQRRLRRNSKYAAFQKRLEVSYQTRLKAERLEKRKLEAERQWVQMLERERQEKGVEPNIWEITRLIISQRQQKPERTEENPNQFDELHNQMEQLSASISQLDNLSKSWDSLDDRASGSEFPKNDVVDPEGGQSLNEFKQALTDTQLDQSTLEAIKEGSDQIKETRDLRAKLETTRG